MAFDKIEAAIIGLAVMGVVGSLSNVGKTFNQFDELKARNLQSTNTINLLDQEEKTLEKQANIANKRYKIGCLVLVKGTHPNLTYSNLSAGDIPTDRHTNKPLVQGTIVCDSQGATAVIQGDGSIGSLAVTSNRAVIESRLKTFRGGMFSQPVTSK